MERACFTVNTVVTSGRLLLYFPTNLLMFRSSHPEVFLGKGVLKICSKFTGEHPCQSAISIKLICNFMEITLRHGCSPVFFLRTPLGGRFCWRHYDCLVFLFRHNFHFDQFLQVIFKRNPSKSCPLVSCYIQFFSCSEELFVLLSEAATRGVL